MSADTRRKIAQLRALAASTTFPEEAASARAKADKLEATLGPMTGTEARMNLGGGYGYMQAMMEEYLRERLRRMMEGHGFDPNEFLHD